MTTALTSGRWASVGVQGQMVKGRWARADLARAIADRQGQMGKGRWARVDIQEWMGKGRWARADGARAHGQGQIGKDRWARVDGARADGQGQTSKGRGARAECQEHLQPLVIHGLVQSLVVLLLPLLHHVVLLQLHGAPHHHLGSLDLVLHNQPNSPLLPMYHHHCVFLAAFDKPVVSVTSQS